MTSNAEISCEACKNNDKPTGLHRCLKCDKSVHLFGCSVAAPDTEEGCGEGRICIECNSLTTINSENNAVGKEIVYTKKTVLLNLILTDNPDLNI